MTTKVGMYLATHESVTVARGQRWENTDRVKNQFYFVGFVSTFFASRRKSRAILNNASFSRHSLVSFVLLLNYKFHVSRDLFLILTNLHLHFEIRSAYLSAHLRKFYRFLSCHLPTSRQNNSHYYTARKPTGKRK